MHCNDIITLLHTRLTWAGKGPEYKMCVLIWGRDSCLVVCVILGWFISYN